MLRAATRALGHAEEKIAALLMAILLVVLGLQVVTRLLDASLSWTEEAARYLFVYIIYFGASGAIRDRSHISIAFLANLVPAPVRLAAALITNALVLFFLGNVLYWGGRAAINLWDVPTPAIELPSGLVYLVLPVTALLMIVRTLAQMEEDWRAGDPAKVEGAQTIVMD